MKNIVAFMALSLLGKSDKVFDFRPPKAWNDSKFDHKKIEKARKKKKHKK
jgi:hypothetical protein